MKIAFYTLGCKVNQYETQVLSQLFAARGWEVLDFSFDGGWDACVVNSCTVTAEGDRKTRQLLRRLRREHPEAALALTGCFPQAFPEEAAALPADVITGSRDRLRLADALERFLATRERVVEIRPHQRGEAFEEMETGDFGRRTRAFVKIEDGCENWCAYCIIPAARGPVRSKAPEALRAELEALAKSGHREVVLSGINLSAYGREFGMRLIDAVELALSLIHIFTSPRSVREARSTASARECPPATAARFWPAAAPEAARSFPCKEMPTLVGVLFRSASFSREDKTDLSEDQ